MANSARTNRRTTAYDQPQPVRHPIAPQSGHGIALRLGHRKEVPPGSDYPAVLPYSCCETIFCGVLCVQLASRTHAVTTSTPLRLSLLEHKAHVSPPQVCCEGHSASFKIQALLVNRFPVARQIPIVLVECRCSGRPRDIPS